MSKLKQSPNIKEDLSKKIETAYFVDYIGKEDFDFEIFTDSLNDFFEFMRELQDIFPEVIRKYTYISLERTTKIEYVPRN